MISRAPNPTFSASKQHKAIDIEFQELAEDGISHPEQDSPPLKIDPFYTELRKTALLYEELWEDLSTFLPDISIVLDKVSQTFEKVSFIKQHRNSIEIDSDQKRDFEEVYKSFCNSVLYERLSTPERSTFSSSLAPENGKKNEYTENNNLIRFQEETEADSISEVVNSIYGRRKGRQYDLPLQFNGRDDFLDFLVDEKLPNKVTKKKKEVLATSFCPFFFIIILVLFGFGKNFQDPYEIFDSQFQRSLLISDLYSNINNIFESQLGIIDKSTTEVKEDVRASILKVQTFEDKIDTDVYERFIRSHYPASIEDIEIPIFLWSPEGDLSGLSIKNATALMLEKADAFIKTDDNSLSSDNKDYVFWAHNALDKYYIALKNWRDWSFEGLRRYSDGMPLNSLLGVLFFCCTLLTIFVSYLNICSIFTLCNNTLLPYLALSQPDLDTLKHNCRAFVDFVDNKGFESEDNTLGEEKRSLLVKSNFSKYRTNNLKHFRKPRSALESTFYNLIGLLTLTSLLLFLCPIPKHRDQAKLLDHIIEDLHTFSEIETIYTFSYITLKQELISETAIFGYKNSSDIIRENNVRLNQLAESLNSEKDKFKDQRPLEDYERFVKASLVENYCDVVEEGQKEQCREFDGGVLTKGLRQATLEKVQNLVDIASDYEKYKENERGLQSQIDDPQAANKNKKTILKRMEDTHIGTFGQVYLRDGLGRIRGRAPEYLGTLFKEGSRTVLEYEFVIVLVWILIVLALYFRVINPLYKIIGQRKKLIKVIPFKLLIGMKEDLLEFIEDYCEVPV